MENPKVSVVIPIYNVERYLRQCIDSVVNQTLKDIEIICVDDGSPDNCDAIIDEYAQKDNRIVAIHKENGGYGSAINYGFSIAKGEYVGIVESDDWIAPNMYELLYNKAIQTDAEIVKGAFWNVEDAFKDKKSISKFVVKLYNRHETFTLNEDPEILSHFASIWSSVYKRDWLKKCNIKLVEDIRPYEDLPFAAEAYSSAGLIALMPEPIYFYRQDAANSSNNAVKRTIVNYVRQRSRVRDRLISNKCYSDEVKEYYWKIAYMGSLDFYNKPNNKFQKEFYYLMKDLFRKAIDDKCEFKYFKPNQIKDFKRILKLSFGVYQLLKAFKVVLQNLFSLTNTKKHKVLTVLGLKIKLSKKMPRYIIKIANILDYVLPKNSKKIIFCSYPDYTDNSKAYYEYLLNNHPNEYELVWLLKGAKEQNIPTKSYKLESLRGIWELLTAKYTVNTFFWLEKYTTSKKRINIQLWHGMPVKTIGYAEKNISKKMFKGYKKNKNSYLFVTSDIFKVSMSASFLCDPKQIYITGQPRTDCIYQNKDDQIIRDFIGKDKYSKIVVYTPTYKEALRNNRREIEHIFNNIFYLDDYSESEFFSLLENKNILFIIKPHPFEEQIYKGLEENGRFNHPNIKIVYNSDMKNNGLYFYEFFSIADLMITDFSSIGIDYLITGKPIIFLNSLANEYNKNRGFTLDDNYEILMPGEKVYNFSQLISSIEDALGEDSWKTKRYNMLPLIHKYRDGKSSERVYNIMRGL